MKPCLPNAITIGLLSAVVSVSCTSLPTDDVKKAVAPVVADSYELADAAIPRLLNLGNHAFPVSTQNEQAQLFINQGLMLAYGFNHAEAGRAFAEAARLDTDLAMAYWGQALVLGPNINAPMNPEDEPRAAELVEQAAQHLVSASAKEQALIQALTKRYSGNAAERQKNDKAYADAMREVYRNFPDDPDVATLFTESVMDLMPWNYWMGDSKPYAETREIVGVIEKTLRNHPSHPGALHLYVHLMEPTAMPERAERAADVLMPLMPDAGHMIHMPSHIFQRVGRYADSVKSNQLAIEADENYIRESNAQGLYPMVYYPHNIHFLWFAATASGQSALALESARKAASKVDDATLEAIPLISIFRVIPYWTLARFGLWQDVLAEPAPPASSAFLTGSWHYVRGLAYAATNQLRHAETELKRLRGVLKNQAQLDHSLISRNTAYAVLKIAPEVLAGEIAAARKQYDKAIAHLDRAVRLEDSLAYTEPFEWHYPPRLALGAVLLEAGRADEAEVVYWDDLKRNRENGWALFGLGQTLRAQDKMAAAAAVQVRFNQAWKDADVQLSASRFGR